MTTLAFLVIFVTAGHISGSNLFVAWLHVVAVSSALHNLLPPWDWDAAFLSDFPKAQTILVRVLHNRWYKLSVKLVGVIALNGRSIAWPSIAMPQQVAKIQNGGTP